jgi:phosphatidylglycerol:prolipoprotein diacylglycerol transferase
VVPAVVRLAFDPVLSVGGFAVRWETVGTALAVLAALVVGALIARRTPRPGSQATLRPDDLLFVVLGATPGAVAGGRLGYVLLHLDFYRSNPGAILDPASGGFELSLAVTGGLLTGLAVASLLDGGARRWAHVAAMPLLLALGFGKAALVLGGTGQGAPSEATWATAYLGPGPWGSLAPSVPSHPAQLYEAIACVVVLLVLIALAASGSFFRHDGRILALGLVLWSLVRIGVATTWRDEAVLGPLRMEQLLALVPLAIGAIAWAAFGRPFRLSAGRTSPAENPAWPDPTVAEGWRAEPDRH